MIKKKKLDADQASRFKQAAKEVGADDSEAEFERKLKQIAKSKPDSRKAK